MKHQIPCLGYLKNYLLVAFFVCALPDDNRLFADAATNIALRTFCPPGFEWLSGNVCKLRTLYEMYSSPKGFGGLRVPLPAARDGFSPQQIDLGRYLFFDPVLSGDQQMSCAHCHHPDLAMADGRARSLGHAGVNLKRSAPSLWNVGFLKSLFWDGRAQSLEEQALGPLLSPEEMNNTVKNLESTLNNIAQYQSLFKDAFPEAAETIASQGIKIENVTQALSAFESSLVSLNSP